MRRWHEDQALMTRRWRQELANHLVDYNRCALAPPGDAHGIDCHCARGIGTMRKSRPYGCPNPRCWICHWDKWTAHSGRSNRRRAAIAFDLDAG